jgi:hypothetical protein
MFSLGSVPAMTSYNNRGIGGSVFLWSVYGLYNQGHQPASLVYSSLELAVTSQYSGRAAVFGEELQSCRRTDPAILEDRQPVKIQCDDSANVIVNCSEL